MPKVRMSPEQALAASKKVIPEPRKIELNDAFTTGKLKSIERLQSHIVHRQRPAESYLRLSNGEKPSKRDIQDHLSTIKHNNLVDGKRLVEKAKQNQPSTTSPSPSTKSVDYFC